MMNLETERLLLRKFEAEDWKAVHACTEDPEVTRFVSWGPPTEQTSQEAIGRLSQTEQGTDGEYWFAIVLTAEGNVIGYCNLKVRSEKNREGEIEYGLHRNHWGNGYATEASKAMLEFGFSQIDLHRITGTCQPQNERSRRVLEKLGMRQEGFLREHKWGKGKWHDTLLLAILDHEWHDSKNDAG